MRVVNNPLSSMSYTNKDFQTIYPELLEAAKNLAKNWDPTISNESDPGVVLLKLSAIIGDKNNYNIDKNVLENYPETYTQEVSARANETLEDSEKNSVVVEEVSETIFEINEKAKKLKE